MMYGVASGSGLLSASQAIHSCAVWVPQLAGRTHDVAANPALSHRKVLNNRGCPCDGVTGYSPAWGLRCRLRGRALKVQQDPPNRRCVRHVVMAAGSSDRQSCLLLVGTRESLIDTGQLSLSGLPRRLNGQCSVSVGPQVWTKWYGWKACHSCKSHCFGLELLGLQKVNSLGRCPVPTWQPGSVGSWRACQGVGSALSASQHLQPLLKAASLPAIILQRLRGHHGVSTQGYSRAFLPGSLPPEEAVIYFLRASRVKCHRPRIVSTVLKGQEL